MYTVINITLPFFLLIFAGSFLSYIKFINKDTLQILAKTAFYVLMPPMIFLNLATSDVSVLFNFKFIVLYELATILLFLFAIPIGTKKMCIEAGKTIEDEIYKPVWQFDSKWTCIKNSSN